MRSISFRRSIAIILAAVMTVSGAMSTFAADDTGCFTTGNTSEESFSSDSFLSSENDINASDDSENIQQILLPEEAADIDDDVDMSPMVTDDDYPAYDGFTSFKINSYYYSPGSYSIDLRVVNQSRRSGTNLSLTACLSQENDEG